MQLIHLTPLLALLSIPTLTLTASDSKPTEPCTIHSPSSGSYYDLTSLSVFPLQDGKKAHKDDRSESWHARGYDYPANFTLNFCAPVIEEVRDVVGVEKRLWRNVSAYYELGGKTYSIGQQSSEPVFRGRKLVLNYTDGSPCDSSSRSASKRAASPSPKLIDDDDDDDDDDEDDRKHRDSKKPKSGSDRHRPSNSPSKSKSPTHRKSTLISLLCDRDPLAPKASVAFVGASPDECAYFFEVRSAAACGGVSDARQSLGPGGVFGVIALIAIFVYLLGGCAYQRTVMHQRGWRQLPNYGMWAGIGSFVKDVGTILVSSLGRLIPSSLSPSRLFSRRRQGYSHLSISANGNGNGHGSGGRGGRGRTEEREDENRLIDQLDEEWDD